jgi:hypothetical protein
MLPCRTDQVCIHVIGGIQAPPLHKRMGQLRRGAALGISAHRHRRAGRHPLPGRPSSPRGRPWRTAWAVGRGPGMVTGDSATMKIPVDIPALLIASSQLPTLVRPSALSKRGAEPHEAVNEGRPCATMPARSRRQTCAPGDAVVSRSAGAERNLEADGRRERPRPGVGRSNDRRCRTTSLGEQATPLPSG